MKSVVWFIVLILMNLNATALAEKKTGRYIWIYDPVKTPFEKLKKDLGELTYLGITDIFLSFEEGPVYLLEKESSKKQLKRVLTYIKEKTDYKVHAMILQDTSWPGDPEKALNRVKILLDFYKQTGKKLFMGMHFDIEPHATDDWPCYSFQEKEAQGALLFQLFQRIRTLCQTEARELIVSASVGWWYEYRRLDIPSLSAASLAKPLDILVLMSYGDPGGPRFGKSDLCYTQKFPLYPLKTNLPPDKGFVMGFATYEFSNRMDLLDRIEWVEKFFQKTAQFKGTAIFRLGAPFNLPDLPIISGRLSGNIASVVIKIPAARLVVKPLKCGLFTIKNAAIPTLKTLVVIERTSDKKRWELLVSPVKGKPVNIQLDLQ